MSKVDFIDVGCSIGGSIDYCIHHYGHNGYGIDIDYAKIVQAQQKGHDARCMSIFDVKDTSSVVTLMHVVEHLESRKEIKSILKKAAAIGDKVYVTFPFFDSDALLYQYGYKFYWSDWHGHTYHLTTYELSLILRDLGLQYEMHAHEQVLSTDSSYIIPLSAPCDSMQYDPETMDEKGTLWLPNTFKEVRCTISSYTPV